MPDNTLLNTGTGGDSMRSIDRSGSGPKTQVVNVDIGASGAGNETILRQGQAVAASSIPVVLPVAHVPVFALDAVASATSPASMTAGVRRDADTSPVSADGRVHPLVFNSIGRLKVSTHPGDIEATTGNITASGQNVAADVSRASNVAFHCTGTFAGVNVTFEGSIDGGTTYFTIQVVRSNANTVEQTSGVIAATPAYCWEASCNAYTHVRVRSTAYTSGTAAFRILPGVFATEPVIATQIAAGNQATNVAQINGVTPLMGNGATGTGALRVSLASDNTGIIASISTSVVPGTAATNLGKAEDAVAASSDTGVMALAVARASPVSSAVAGRYHELQVNSLGSLWVQPTMGVTGGATPFQQISAATTNAANVKASAGTLTSIVAGNNHATNWAYLKLHNTAGTPTAGSGVVATYPIPPGGGLSLAFPTGMAFATGIGLSVTGGIAAADTTSTAASQVVIALTFH